MVTYLLDGEGRRTVMIDLVALSSQNVKTTDTSYNAQLENEFVDDTNIPFMSI